MKGSGFKGGFKGGGEAVFCAAGTPGKGVDENVLAQ